MRTLRLRIFQLLLVSVLLVFAGVAQGTQNTTSLSANVTAIVTTGIAISKTADLNFGDIVPSVAAGTVLVSTAGARSTTGTLTLGSGVAVSAAVFDVTIGGGNPHFQVTVPASAITLGRQHHDGRHVRAQRRVRRAVPARPLHLARGSDSKRRSQPGRWHVRRHILDNRNSAIGPLDRASHVLTSGKGPTPGATLTEQL